MIARKDDLVGAIRAGAERSLARTQRVTLIRGHARLTGTDSLEVDGRRRAAGRMFINTGARPRIPAIAGLDDVPYLDSSSAMDLTDLPAHLVVDDRLETNVPGIWGLGDARGGAMFTHTERDDARIVLANVTKGRDLDTRGRTIPYAVFTEPRRR
jgi:pyruvate/2-oxoglutarate dehydrogenase complex dihydrolipoamide dehydrogenase (E3) component